VSEDQRDDLIDSINEARASHDAAVQAFHDGIADPAVYDAMNAANMILAYDPPHGGTEEAVGQTLTATPAIGTAAGKETKRALEFMRGEHPWRPSKRPYVAAPVIRRQPPPNVEAIDVEGFARRWQAAQRPSRFVR
jgi:hypothetical protein